MIYTYSQKALVLTQDKRHEMAIKTGLLKFGVEIEKKILNLSSLDTIRSLSVRTKNTSFIRAELYTFIREFGLPYIVVLDLRIPLGFDKTEDPDNMKLFRTFLISYIIFSMGRGFDRVHCDLLVLYDETDEALAKKLVNPMNVLQILMTKNTQVNEVIESMKADVSLFKKIITIEVFPKSEITQSFDKKIAALNIAIATKRGVADKMLNKALVTVSNESVEPADVYYNSGRGIYLNGEETEDRDDVPKGTLLIEGKWTSATTKDVSERVRSILLHLVNSRVIQFENELTLVLGEKCIIDASVAPALAGILIKDLSRFKNVKVSISKFNQPVLSKSEGYSMIKEYIYWHD
jgi:hypothetical protein